MKILMVQRFDLLTVSCARRVLAMAEELVRRGYEVTLTHFPHSERQQQLPHLFESLPDGVACLELDRRGGGLLRNIGRVTKAAKDADLVHLWKCYPDAAIPALWAAYREGKPLHYDWDDYEAGISLEMTGSRCVSHVVAFWERVVPRLADTVTVASAALKQKALAYGVSPECIWDAPVGADLERFRPAEEEPAEGPHLLYVGQLEVASFAEMALEGFARIAGDFPAARLTIAGGGRHLESLRAQVGQLRLEGRVELTGYLPADSIPALMQRATLALAPFEDTPVTRCKSPLKIVEYLAAGLPVIGSGVGEVPRMLEGCGVCVPPGDAGIMAEAIKSLLEEPEKRRAMRREARRRAETLYNWGRTVDELESAYRNALCIA